MAAIVITPSSAFPIDPRSVASVKVHQTIIDFDGDVAVSRVSLLDANGEALTTISLVGSSAAVSTWIAARRVQVANFVMDKLGIAGSAT